MGKMDVPPTATTARKRRSLIPFRHWQRHYAARTDPRLRHPYKKAARAGHQDLANFPPEKKAKLIARSADEVISANSMPTSSGVWQPAAHPDHMNVNEVIAIAPLKIASGTMGQQEAYPPE